MKRREFIRLAGMGAAGMAAEYGIRGPRSAGAVETPKREKESADPDQLIVREGIERLKSNEPLRNEIGDEAFQTLLEAIESVDIGRINAATEELSGVSKSDIPRKSLASFDVLSESQWREQGGWLIALASVDRKNNMRLRGAKFFDPSEQAGVDVRTKIIETFIHEYNHVVTTDPEVQWNPADMSTYARWITRDNLSQRFYEGATELHAMRIAKHMGLEIGRSGYNDAALTAFVVGEIVGQKLLSKAYFTGDTAPFEQAFDSVCGDGAFERTLRQTDWEQSSFIGGTGDTYHTQLLPFMIILRSLSKLGVDHRKILDDAESFGLSTSDIEVTTGEEGVVDGIVDFQIAHHDGKNKKGELIHAGDIVSMRGTMHGFDLQNGLQMRTQSVFYLEKAIDTNNPPFLYSDYLADPHGLFGVQQDDMDQQYNKALEEQYDWGHSIRSALSKTGKDIKTRQASIDGRVIGLRNDEAITTLIEKHNTLPTDSHQRREVRRQIAERVKEVSSAWIQQVMKLMKQEENLRLLIDPGKSS